MKIIEISGQPCAGKSTLVTSLYTFNNLDFIYNPGFTRKLINFFKGIKYLGFNRLHTIFIWSLDENASIFFRLNIFRNAVTKFGVFQNLSSLKHSINCQIFIDEGISHLPFLFPNQQSLEVINFISPELQEIIVWFIESPEEDLLKERLLERGHKRLRFLSISNFLKKNMIIENIILKHYSNLCLDFVTSGNAKDFL
ncbi:MAG: hypothetical protein VW894_00030 [Gammaproteobacteria bacterium]